MDASVSPLPTPATTPASGGTTTTAVASASSGHGHSLLWSGEDFSFGDVLDVINPLQHIPVVSTIYRAVTGDRIGHLPQLLGDTLYGGAMGAASAVANIATEEITGKDIGEQVLSALGLDGGSPSSTQLASTGGAPAAPRMQVVALSRGPMDPEDRHDDGTGGIDNGKVWGVAPVLNPMLASAPGTNTGGTNTGGTNKGGAGAGSGNPAPAVASVAPISGSGLSVPAGGPLAASMAAADVAVAAGISGLDGGINVAGAQMPAGAPVATTPGTLASAATGMRPLISSSQGGMVRSLSGQTLSNHAVPLNLPNNLAGGFRHSPTVQQPLSPPVGLGVAAADNVGVTVSNSATATSGVPIDISQRMIDALDRYNQLEAVRKAAQTNTVNGVH